MPDREIVYIVEMQGVYGQGISGVFPTQEEATAFAESQLADSDWYHEWLVHEWPIGAAIDNKGRHTPYGATTDAQERERLQKKMDDQSKIRFFEWEGLGAR